MNIPDYDMKRATLLRFSRGDNPVGSLISLATRSWASHVDIVLPSGLLVGAVPGQGVIIRDPQPVAREEYWLAPVAGAWLWGMKEYGRPYDWRGVLGLYCPDRDWHCPDSWFCSELVAHCLEKCNLSVVRADAHRVTPADLLRSPLLHLAP
jgi:hypothetical protein